jgi:molybdopterin-synthase adenylyltransferase
MCRLSSAMTSDTAERLSDHLLRSDGQEDLCFALYRASTGTSRSSALVAEPILPEADERKVHGNASFTADYFLRALGLAEEAGAGLALAHSHPSGRGWQGMSIDDLKAERGHAAQAWAVTGLPLVGLAIAGDGAFSARTWDRVGRSSYVRRDHESVRVLGQKLEMTFNPHRLAVPSVDDRLVRTVSAWGDEAQAVIGRLRVGVVGLGSVGMLVAEALARTGVRDLALLDFDSVRLHNLDRLAHATRLDAALMRCKVDVARDALIRLAPCDDIKIQVHDLSVVEPEGFREMAGCDVVFSCVDRPWPRQVLDHLAFAHLVPVVDGGILVSSPNARLANADWKAHISAPGRRCLGCIGQYQPAEVALERAGDLDDPVYIQGLPEAHPLRASANVFAFSAATASLEVLQMLSMVVSPQGLADVGEWNFHWVTGSMDVTRAARCEVHCPVTPKIGLGDAADIPTGPHKLADEQREARNRHQRRAKVRVVRQINQMSRFHASVGRRAARWIYQG